jgi:hypothetical protein
VIKILGNLRFKTMILLVFTVSFTIFLGVIALNFLAIGQVRDMNQQLREGPLENRQFWQVMATQLGRAEQLRRQFQLDRTQETAELMRTKLAQIDGELTNRSTSEALSATVRGSVTAYGHEFQSLVDTDTALRETRVELLKSREMLETAIYDLESPELEEALGEFLLAELDFFASPDSKDKVGALKVLMDQILRDAPDDKESPLPQAISEYGKVFSLLLSHQANVSVRTQALEEQVQAILLQFDEAVVQANQMADMASNSADNKANQARTLALIWTGIGLVLAMVLATLFERTIFKKLGGDPIDLAKVANMVAQGNWVVERLILNVRARGGLGSCVICWIWPTICVRLYVMSSPPPVGLVRKVKHYPRPQRFSPMPQMFKRPPLRRPHRPWKR